MEETGEMLAGLLENLSGDKSKDIVEKAMAKLLETDREQVTTLLIPIIENAVRKASSEDDFIWIAWIRELVQKMGLEDFLTPRTSRILVTNELLLSDIQF